MIQKKERLWSHVGLILDITRLNDAIHYAAQAGNSELVEELLKRKAERKYLLERIEVVEKARARLLA